MENIDQSITVNRYFSLTQLSTTASTYFDVNGGGFSLGKVENVGVQGTVCYDGQFKTGIPEGLIKHYCFLKPFSVSNYPVQHSTSQFIDILSQVSSIDQRSSQKTCCHFYWPHNCIGLLGPALPSTKRYQVTKR